MAKANTPASGSKGQSDSADSKKPGKSNAAKAAPATTETTSKAASAPSPAKPDGNDAAKTPAEAKSTAKDTTAKKVETTSVAESPEKATEKPDQQAAAAANSDDKDTAAKPEAKITPPAPTVEPESAGSIFWPLVIGGLIAGALGFLAAELNLIGMRGDRPDVQSDIARIEQAQTGQDKRITALEDAEPTDVQTPELGGIKDSLAALSDTLSDFETRLAELESRPASADAGDPGAAQEYASELAALQESLAQQKAEIDQLLNNAVSVEEATAEAARKTAIQAALTEITAALTAGAGFAAPVAALQENGVSDLPAGMVQAAEAGVATLSALQAEFPDLARAALVAARASGASDDGAGLSGFLKRQLGARSVAPREGSDPDAILSRAEDAVRNGQVARALTEMQGLPEEAKAPMADWIAAAQARAETQAALEELSQRLSAN